MVRTSAESNIEHAIGQIVPVTRDKHALKCLTITQCERYKTGNVPRHLEESSWRRPL
jgi:hypothetical protein